MYIYIYTYIYILGDLLIGPAKHIRDRHLRTTILFKTFKNTSNSEPFNTSRALQTLESSFLKSRLLVGGLAVAKWGGRGGRGGVLRLIGNSQIQRSSVCGSLVGGLAQAKWGGTTMKTQRKHVLGCVGKAVAPRRLGFMP